MGFVDKDGDGEIDFDEFLTMVTTNIKNVRVSWDQGLRVKFVMCFYNL
jgi:hypothetical protein